MDVPEVLIENLRQALAKDTKPFPFGPRELGLDTEQAQSVIALWNAASSVVKVADGEPDATYARLRWAQEHPDD